LTLADPQLASLVQLRAQIEGIDRAARNPLSAAPEPDNPSYSFGLLSDVCSISNAQQTVETLVASVQEMLQKLAPVATIETSRDGMTARTVIHYTGRAASVWVGSDPTEPAAVVAAMHLDSLRKTYALRRAFVATVGAVGSALVSISLSVANPLTVLHALASAKALKQALERMANMVESAR